MALHLLERWFALHRATMDLKLAFDLHRNEQSGQPKRPERRQPAEWPRYRSAQIEPAPLLDWQG
jgi:hypothetical protein